MDFRRKKDEDEQYAQSIKRLKQYRQKLVAQIEKHDFDFEKFDEFRHNITIKLQETLIFYLTEYCSEDLQDLALPSITDELIAKIVLRERAKLVIKMLYSLKKSFDEIQLLFPAIQKDYKKSDIPKLIKKIDLLCRHFFDIIKIFNIFRQIGIVQSSLYKCFYKFVEHNNFKIYELLKEIFNWSFTLVHWPLISLDTFSDPSKDELELFVQLFKFLLNLSTGDLRIESIVGEKISICYLNISEDDTTKKMMTPIQLLMDPFVKRFDFYFFRHDSKLNNLENPEWYLCQVEQWITRNEPFLIQKVDPILYEYFGDDFKSSKIELMCYLSKLVKKKLDCDEPLLVDDRIFISTIDETIIFVKQIEIIQPGFYEIYPELNPLGVFFTQDYYHNRFIQIEKNKFDIFMESIFESENSWILVYGREENDDDKYLICEAADNFALLTRNLIERSSYIPSPTYQSKILDLILELLDDFRLRLSQSIHDYSGGWPFSQKFFAILNTFDYVFVLTESLNSNPVLNPSESQRLSIANLAKMSRHMIDEVFELIQSVIKADFSFNLQEYGNLRWNAMSIDNLIISKAALELFYNVSSKINFVKKYVSSNLFDELIHDIAFEIQETLISDFILKQAFNRDGIKQFEFDIKKGLFTTFSMFMKNVEFTFARICECLTILNFSPETYFNLRELRKVLSPLEFKVYLQRNLGIYSLKPFVVMDILDNIVEFTSPIIE